jgi:phosphoribosylformylglycinamidine synthase PurS subunit
MEFNAEVRVELKKGVTDAEGDTVQKSLKMLGYPITKVKVARVFMLVVEADSKEVAEKKVEDACTRLLANPVIQNYAIEIK